ncbi:uncharacterized protein LOC118746572 [Rhagoletis pomonella]|uniref:uncharacterized protein LOC118746572 n=1 Tax=Rhagoletis pomonella TaxID=28610 RepID=UPI001780DEE5|nr:uncharacterized protein LOC118746572 [Rhagoletis pomonella]
MGTILDARFKKEGLSSNTADSAVKALEDEIASLGRAESSSHYYEEPSTSPNVQLQPEQSLFKFINNKVAERKKSKRVDAVITLRQYLNKPNAFHDIDPLTYLKQRK